MTRLPWSSANPISILNIKTIIVIFCREFIRIIILFHYYYYHYSHFVKLHCIFMTKGKINKLSNKLNGGSVEKSERYSLTLKLHEQSGLTQSLKL